MGCLIQREKYDDIHKEDVRDKCSKQITFLKVSFSKYNFGTCTKFNGVQADLNLQ